MKAVILAGGLGTRLSEETSVKPKPMVEIGGRPIIWHIMKIYAYHGVTDFIVCCGYKGYVLKEYFSNYVLHNSDVTFDLESNRLTFHKDRSEPWRVTLVDTGLVTNTGGRLKRVEHFIDDDTFCLTYGDGVSDVDVTALIDFHKKHGRLATLTSVIPAARFGALHIEGSSVKQFREKPADDHSWVNGGFFVLSKKVLGLIEDDTTVWEKEPLEKLAAERELCCFKHAGFWQPMDTLRDKVLLDNLWNQGQAPWKVW